MRKIDKFKQAIQALHFNLFISEAIITFLSIVKVSPTGREEEKMPTVHEGIPVKNSDILIDGRQASEIDAYMGYTQQT